ncbi:MAG TPA: HD domain-containing protein [Verrucomicrobiae bacterium]|nr:HD domain-containing protein [Verrucomicrobiae bacterium]
MPFPDDDTIQRLHKKYAPHDLAFTIVYGHCQIIAEISLEIIDKRHLDVTRGFVRAAALLHDIGYYPLFDASGYVPRDRLITHGVTGAELLRAENIPEPLCRIAERHTGVGLTRDSILKQKLPLPARDLIPETPTEWLITYADKLHTKAIMPNEPHDVTGYFNSPESYLRHAAKFGEANAARFAELIEVYGTPDLVRLASQHQQPLR